ITRRIPPLSVEKLPVVTMSIRMSGDSPEKVQLELPTETGSDKVALDHPLKDPAGPFRRTLLSSEDDSVQEYAVRTATEKETAVVLSLHGAGVDCMGQINAYSSKPEFTIVAPTNRRPYGFDWQDWGRTNAYEALGAAYRSIPQALYLTGH